MRKDLGCQFFYLIDMIRLIPLVFANEECPALRFKVSLSETSKVFRFASTAASTTLRPHKTTKKTAQ